MPLPGFTAETALEDTRAATPEAAPRSRLRIPVPGLASGAVGLGDVVSRAAAHVGLSPCGGCRRRAQAMNAWLSFGPRR
jgi:hypothetical protein